MSKVILTSESVCDIGAEQLRDIDLKIIPYHIFLDGKEYLDGVKITREEIFDTYRKRHILPKTGAINVDEFTAFFTPLVEQGCEIVHISLGSGISCTYQNAVLAAESLPGVYPVDSRNLSTGLSTLILYAERMIRSGMTGAQVQAACEALRTRVHGSFVIDTLEFLAAGGRCSSLAALGANILKLHPVIEVNSADGTMHVGKKYRGSLAHVLPQYFYEFASRFTDVETDFIFLTHAGSTPEEVELAREALLRAHPYKNIFVTEAGTTISTHCGPKCIGCFVVSKE